MSDNDVNPLDAIRARADELGFEGEEKDDYVQGRMARLGFKKGPGDWIREEDDDTPQDDDDEPVTRADIRRMEREKARRATLTPPKKAPENAPKGKVQRPKPSGNTNSWW